MTFSTNSGRAQFVHIFLLVLSLSCLLLWCENAFCQAAVASPAPIRTSPTNMGVDWVDASGKVPPQLTMRNDFYLYPGTLSYRTFLAQPTESSPEAFLARYIQALPDTQSAMAYRDPAEDKAIAAKDVAADQAITKGIADLRLKVRYDVGAFTLIAGIYVNPDGKQFPTAIYGIHATSDGYRITRTGTSPPDTAVVLFFDTGWDIYDLGPHWNDAPKPRYQYSLDLPGPFPANLHPVTIFFNGKPSHLLIDSKTVPTGPISAFVKRVVQTYRSGTQSQWLALWTQTDIKENWNPDDVHMAGSYKLERARFNRVRLYQVFTIDFGPNAAVFFADSNKPSEPLTYLLLWKEGASGYRLTTGVNLRPGTNTFDDNVKQFFDSSEFQKYLRSVVGQPTAQKSAQHLSAEK